MVQTLMALLALTLATLFMFNQERSIRHIEMTMIRNEVMAQATSVAVDRLDEIGAMAYDERTKGDTRLASSSQLTESTAFVADAPPIDDIDDFDGAQVQNFRVAWGDTLWFYVGSQIAYADEVFPDQAVASPTVRTKFKKVTVTVYSLDLARPDTIRISQSFACGSKCNW